MNPPDTETAPQASGSPVKPLEVVIAGGGVAALEAALALRSLAGDRVALKMIARAPDFVYRPMTVVEPFAEGSARRYPLAEIASDLDVELLADSFAWVDGESRVAHTEAGLEVPYDALLLAIGGHPNARYEHALTIDDTDLDELMHGLIEDVEGGYVGSVAFVIPGRMAWPLPIYELALMIAARAYDMQTEVALTIVTPEEHPLGVFGLPAAAEFAELLSNAGISTITSAHSEIPSSGHVTISPGERHLEVDRIVALPELFGPAVRGLRASAHGFIPVDLHGRVRAAERVFAAGDATDFAVKHGGIASQQADAAAQSIAALAGVDIEPEPFKPIIRAMLLTGRGPKFLSARITGGQGFDSEISDTAPWSPPSKISARYLAPYLDQRFHTAEGSGSTR